MRRSALYSAPCGDAAVFLLSAPAVAPGSLPSSGDVVCRCSTVRDDRPRPALISRSDGHAVGVACWRRPATRYSHRGNALGPADLHAGLDRRDPRTVELARDVASRPRDTRVVIERRDRRAQPARVLADRSPRRTPTDGRVAIRDLESHLAEGLRQ